MSIERTGTAGNGNDDLNWNEVFAVGESLATVERDIGVLAGSGDSALAIELIIRTATAYGVEYDQRWLRPCFAGWFRRSEPAHSRKRCKSKLIESHSKPRREADCHGLLRACWAEVCSETETSETADVLAATCRDHPSRPGLFWSCIMMADLVPVDTLRDQVERFGNQIVERHATKQAVFQQAGISYDNVVIAVEFGRAIVDLAAFCRYSECNTLFDVVSPFVSLSESRRRVQAAFCRGERFGVTVPTSIVEKVLR